jgi:putative hydrolase of the HAD superfamily
MYSALKSKKVWIFDLDSTLYSKDCGFEASRQSYKVFARLKGCTDDEAKALYGEYAAKYGAAPFTGIIKESGINIDAFIEEAFVNVPMDSLPISPELPTLLNSINAQKIVFSNCPKKAIDNILEHLGLANSFDEIFGLERLDYLCKPHKDAFNGVLSSLNVQTPDCVMVEDQPSNLAIAKELGMTTILVHGEPSSGVSDDPSIDFRFDTIEKALKSAV